jgi:hypothetical protein
MGDVDIDSIGFNDVLKTFKEDGRPAVQNDMEYFQAPFRALICGPSGCGKTSALLDALLKGKLHFDKLYIYAKDLGEAKYQMLIDHFSKVAKSLGMNPSDLLVVGESEADIIMPEDLDRKKNNLIIFDDWIASRHAMEGPIKAHFSRGRKMGASYAFITQSYYSTPKDIRLNCEYYQLFKMPTLREKRQICNEMSTDIDYERFVKLFEEATKNKHGWMLVDKKSDIPEMKFRKGWRGLCKCEDTEELS